MAMELHQTKAESLRRSDQLDALKTRNQTLLKQVWYLDNQLQRKNDALMPTATRYAKTLDWMRRLCGGTDDDTTTITAEDAMADTETKMDIIDRVETILHGHVQGKDAEIERLKVQVEVESMDHQRAVEVRDAQIARLEQELTNRPSKKQARTRFGRSSASSSRSRVGRDEKCSDVKKEEDVKEDAQT